MLSIQVRWCAAFLSGRDSFIFVQISFGSFVYPSLVLAYLGQGSRLIVDGVDVLPNVFYLTIPGKHNGPLFWTLYVFAILATLIASQAMITACFSLVQQLVNMRSLPPCARYLFFLHWVLGLAHMRSGSVWYIHQTKSKVKFICLLLIGFVSILFLKDSQS
jgi:K+ potassium transporter